VQVLASHMDVREYATNTWPACGEIDIGVQRKSTNYSLRNYIILVTLVVTETEVQQLLLLHQHFIFIKQYGSCICKIYVDDVLFHTVANTASLPFNKDFFLILNVAMGGTFGAIDLRSPIINGD
jgi:hypothetical protein